MPTVQTWHVIHVITIMMVIMNTELRELLGFDPVSLVIKKGRLRWIGHGGTEG